MPPESSFATLMAKVVFLLPGVESRLLFTKLSEACFERGRQIFCRSSSPVMKEDHNRLLFDHVVMDHYHIDSVFAQSLGSRYPELPSGRELYRCSFLQTDTRRLAPFRGRPKVSRSQGGATSCIDMVIPYDVIHLTHNTGKRRNAWHRKRFRIDCFGDCRAVPSLRPRV